MPTQALLKATSLFHFQLSTNREQDISYYKIAQTTV